MSKTIKQIADEIGVSKQAVHQKRKSPALSTALQPFTTIADGVVYISVDGEKLIKQAFLKQPPSTDAVNEFTPVDGFVDAQKDRLYSILEKELAAKNKLIEKLEADLEEERKHSREISSKLAKLADQAQSLHAGTMQQQLAAGSSESQEEVAIEAEPVDPDRAVPVIDLDPELCVPPTKNLMRRFGRMVHAAIAAWKGKI